MNSLFRTSTTLSRPMKAARSLHRSSFLMQSAADSYTFNVNNILDKEHENKSLKEVSTLPPSAMQGLTPQSDVTLEKFKIKTIKDLGTWKAHHLAQAAVGLAIFEEDATEDGKKGRKSAAVSNLFGAFDKEYRSLTLKALCKTPPHSIKGLAPWVDDEFLNLNKKLTTIEAFAAWKYPVAAAHLCTLAYYEEENSLTLGFE